MDPLQNKRPGTQTPRQITKTTFGNSPVVPRDISSRRPMITPRIVGNPIVPRRPQLAVSSGGYWPTQSPLRQPQSQLSPTLQSVQTSPAPIFTDLEVHPEPVPQAAIRPVTTPLQAFAEPVAEPVAESYTPARALQSRLVPLDMELPLADSAPSQFNSLITFATRRRFRRLAFRGLAVTVVLAITLGGLLFSQSYLKLHKVFKGGTATAEALKPTVNPDLLKGEGSGRVNILLLGRGGGTHDAPDLTDTMMLVSIDPVNHTSTLLSVPRDLWVNVPNQGVMKINAAWETGVFKYLGKQTTGSTNRQAITAGFDMVDKTVGDVLGLSINYNVLVDFNAFKQAVDTVGGVNINVPADLVDPTMAWENANNPVLAKAGAQVFDGTHALIYARSRETTSDFARAERQRAMLVALKGKVATLGTLSNPLKLSGLLSAFGNNVQTDLSLSNASRLYDILKNVDDTKVTSVGLSDAPTPHVTGGNINGQSIVLPKAGLFKYDDIQQFVRSQLKDPYIMQENAKILVLNGSTLSGLATIKGDQLKGYGYNVIGVGNTPNSGWTQTTLIDLTHKNKYTKNYLEQRLSQKAANSLNDTTIPTNGADFVIIIGSDEANSTQP